MQKFKKYFNIKIHLKFFAVATLHSGLCLENEKYCSVDLHYEPVCGSDHKIYTNMQSLLCVRHKQSKGTVLNFSYRFLYLNLYTYIFI